jgi:hypothetical protein
MATYFCVNSSLGQTWNSSNTVMWSTTSGLTSVPAGPPQAADTATFDGASGGGTVTVGSSINTTNTVSILTMGAFTGALDFSVNNISPTIGTMTNSGTATRTLNMGSGTWTITGNTGNPWNFTTVTGLTLVSSLSTILLSATAAGSRTLQFGGTTINNLSISNPSRNNLQVRFADAVTVGGSLTISNVGNVRVDAALTVTGAWAFDGTSTNPAVLYLSAPTTFTVGAANTWTWIYVQNITKAGAGSITANNSFDGGSNTNITINSPPSGGGGGIIGG